MEDQWRYTEGRYSRGMNTVSKWKQQVANVEWFQESKEGGEDSFPARKKKFMYPSKKKKTKKLRKGSATS